METHQLNILAIGRQAAIMDVMQRLINVAGKWTGKAVVTDEEAITAFSGDTFDMVLLCAGINEEEETSLRKQLLSLRPTTTIIRHYGGGSGLLENEIRAAMEQQPA